ncbi:MAG: hypothetical protein ABOK23_11890 [Candidatus Methanoperedens sp.]|nr:hypothetical protein [Candidatus Methanoperedens sp.]MCZ7395247.1 hypothetical protein [Candidatus Methanoperedens sp.]
MIFNGKSIQSVANSTIYPFLNDLLQSEDEIVVRETLNQVKIFADLGMEGRNFLGLQKVLYHKNINVARNSLDILRKMSPGVKNVEVKADIWKSMYPFFCDQALSAPVVALDALNIVNILVDYGIVGDYKNLQKALLHKRDNVAHLAFDILRKIDGLTIETGVERVKLVSDKSSREVKKKDEMIKEKEQPLQKETDTQSRISNVLKKNPKYVESLREIKSKYNI